MALTPLDIQKMRFNQRMRGFDTTEVEGFLVLIAEELAGRLAQIEKLDRENKYYRQRLEESTSSSRPCCAPRRSPTRSPTTPAARPS
jgi:DivIVA domain-containing protein